MQTDHQLYELFSAVPEYFFDLTDINYPAKYSLRKETIKEISRRMDGLMVPDNPNAPYLVVEFQLQKDIEIYYRIVMEMAGLGIKNKGCNYHGVIILANQTLAHVCAPWSDLFKGNNPAFRQYYLNDLLKSLETREPGHPLVAVFQPYLQTNLDELEKNAGHYYNQIQSGNLSADKQNKLGLIYMSWLLVCFRDKSYEEVIDMLDLTTPLEETVAYKELVAIGEKEGEKLGRRALLDRQLRMKFGNDFSAFFQNRLQEAGPEQLDTWAVRILEANSIEEVFREM